MVLKHFIIVTKNKVEKKTSEQMLLLYTETHQSKLVTMTSEMHEYEYVKVNLFFVFFFQQQMLLQFVVDHVKYEFIILLKWSVRSGGEFLIKKKLLFCITVLLKTYQLSLFS